MIAFFGFLIGLACGLLIVVGVIFDEWICARIARSVQPRPAQPDLPRAWVNHFASLNSPAVTRRRKASR